MARRHPRLPDPNDRFDPESITPDAVIAEAETLRRLHQDQPVVGAPAVARIAERVTATVRFLLREEPDRREPLAHTLWLYNLVAWRAARVHLRRLARAGHKAAQQQARDLCAQTAAAEQRRAA